MISETQNCGEISPRDRYDPYGPCRVIAAGGVPGMLAVRLLSLVMLMPGMLAVHRFSCVMFVTGMFCTAHFMPGVLVVCLF